MINAQRQFPPVTVKGLLRNISALVDFVVAVGKTAAGDAEANVGVWSQARWKCPVPSPCRWARAATRMVKLVSLRKSGWLW